MGLDIIPTDVRGTFRLVGELDIANVGQTQARLEEELRARDLTLDTSQLSFMDSQGIRMLIMLGEQAISKGSVVLVLNCSEAVSRTLEIAVPQGIPGVEVVDAGT
jgi:anti-anti-sigma factor